MLIRKGSSGSLVLKWQKFLNVQGADLDEDGIFGEGTRTATIKFQKKYKLDADGIAGPFTFAKASTLGFKEPKPVKGGKITMEQLSYIMRASKKATIKKHLSLVNKCMETFEINTPLRQQHFLAQCGHESASLYYMHEIASGAQYEGRKDLGNTKPGDGRRFRGRGPIQLTGRNNYTAFFDYIEKPELIKTPEFLEVDYSLAWLASGWYWTIYAKVNRWADQDNAEMVTRSVNGGLNGYGDRLQYLHRAKEVIPNDPQ